MRKTVYLIRGLPGSGKTCLAHKIAWHPLSRAIAADDFPNRYMNGALNPEVKNSEVHAWVENKVRGWLKSPFLNTIAIHNVFSKVSHFENYVALAVEHGWSVQVIDCEGVVLLSGKLAQNTHNVPSEAVQHWSLEWEPFYGEVE